MAMNRVSETERLIAAKLHALRKKNERVRMLNGVLYTLAAAMGLFGSLAVVEGLFYLSAGTRTVLVGLSAAFTVLIFLFFFIKPFFASLGLMRRTGDLQLAGLVGRRFPTIKDRLLNLLQITEERKGGRSLYSPELIDASYTDLTDAIEKNDLCDAVTFRRPAQTIRSLVYGLAFFTILYIVSPAHFGNAINRVLHYGTEFKSPSIFSLNIEPGDIEAIRGDSVTIRVSVEGEPQPAVSLYTRGEGQVSFEEFKLEGVDGRTFTHTINQVRRNTEYYAAQREERTSSHKITVIDRPSIRHLSVRLTYPRYTGIPERTLEDNAGTITTLRGTRIHITVTSNKTLAHARLSFREAGDLEMTTQGTAAHTEFTVRDNDSYTVQIEDTDGITNSNPIEYTVRAIADEYPVIAIVQPGEDRTIDENLVLPLLFRIQDDFGFSGLQLGYRLVQSRFEPERTEYTYVDLQLPSDASNDEVIEHLWNVRGLNLSPEDVVSYHAVVYDNDTVSGPKRSQSDSYLFRLPSLDEIFAEVDRQHRQSRDELEYSVEEARELRRELEEIQRELRLAQHEMNWERQQRMQEMLDRYDALQERLEETGQELDTMIDEMERQQVLSRETLEKYFELQELYEQLSDPEFKKAMEKMREAIDRMDPNELREAMRNVTVNEEQFRQSIERMLNLLKRVQIEQKVDEILKRAEQMIDEQASLSDELAAAADADPELTAQLSEKMEDLQRQLEQLERALEELRQRMEEFPAEMPLGELSKTMQEMSEADLNEQIEMMKQQMQQDNMQGAQQQHGQIQQDLSQMQQNLAQMQQSLLEDQMRRIVNEMRRALRNLNELSKRQEQLRDDTRSLEPNSQLFQDNARSQSEVLSDLSSVVDDLVALSQKTFAITPEMGRAIGEAFRQMTEAMDRLEARSGGQASDRQGGAMSSMNEAAFMLGQSLQAMMQGGGEGGMGGFLQRLQNMAGQQQQINLGTQSVGEGQLTMEQQAQLGRLAAEQEAVRRSLEELKREMEGTGQRERILGDLDRIEREMQEVVRNLQSTEIQPETIQRQERILSRLLDAQRSIRERDFEERREGRLADQIVRESPPEFDLSTQEGRDRLREDMIRAVREGYSRDYELLIRRYFEMLQQMERE
jgi:predicted Zn-dependent protease with MMP-like domain